MSVNRNKRIEAQLARESRDNARRYWANKQVKDSNMNSDGAAQCPHDETFFSIRHDRFEDTNINYAEITGKCTKCGAPVRFHVRAPLGCHPELVTQAMDASNVNIPFLFGDDEYDGKAMGFVGRMTTEENQ